MSPGFGKAAYLAAFVAMAVVRAPHIRRSRSVAVAKNRYGALDVTLVVLVGVGVLLLPVLWVATPWLDAADYPLVPGVWGAGLLVYALGLWLLHRSHVDLGRNWSNTLQVRESHTLVTGGVYRRLQHPMYTALLLHAVGQALTVPNLVAGPTFLATFALLVATRLGPEERMMREEFGEAHARWARATKRLVPGVW